uniref:Uncharacterized protein n=1 Tax=Anopheles culicifacies TaxID=139723 RepID=A0A182MJ82_9DIPT
MATVISLLSNLCNSPFDQQHSHHHHHPPQLLFPPYGQGPETLQQRYSGTGAGGRNRNEISPGYNLDNEDTYSESPNNFQDYQNNFVDSPPDSKEPWPIDYNKMHTTIATSSGANDTTNASTTVTAVATGTVAAVTSQQQQQQQQPQQDNGGMYMSNAILPSRKRRMEWMSPQEEDTDGTETKIANIDKERDARRKGKCHVRRAVIISFCFLINH